MHLDSLSYFRCPETHRALSAEGASAKNGQVVDGFIGDGQGHKYPVAEGIVNFLRPEDLVGDAAFANKYYTRIAETYDDNLHITFDLYNENEVDIRTRMIDLLHLKPTDKVLEVSAGTGKDSEIIASRLGKNGRLFALDITPAMIARAAQRLRNSEVPAEFVVGTAVNLPFNDNSFDALYCFAGIGHFPDLKKGLQEMARVVKPGGRVVFCEKNVPLWLRNTEYGRILINNNPMFAYEPPLPLIPVEARDLGIRWINGNVHYVVDYTVGDGEPKGNFDSVLPGERGGSFKTRYFGQLEGVTPEAKELAIKARNKLGISMHQWLDNLVKEAAKKVLKEGE